MTRRDSFIDELEEFLDEHQGPPELPDAVRDGILAELPNVRRSGPYGLRRYPNVNSNISAPVSYGVVAAGLAAVAVIGALVLTDAGRGLGGPGESPGTSPTPTPTPQTAALSDHPFTYVIDPSTGLELTSPDPAIYQFRVPARPPDTGYDEGVIVHSGGDGLRSDVCASSGGDVNADPTPQDFVELVTSLEGLQVSTPEQTTVDDRPAIAVTVGGDENRPCDYYVFDNLEPAFSSDGNEAFTRRFYAFEVDQDLVVVVVTATDASFDAWLPAAEDFIATLDFGE
jgi:hypothetical protein